MAKRTPFYDLHLAANAKMVDFAGWDMPLHYGSQLEEHHLVRKSAGLFDVSHMGVVDVKGKETLAFLRKLVANNIDKITEGRAIYTCMLNEQGTVLDDLILYRISNEFFRIVINAGRRENDMAWMRAQAKSFNVELTERTDLVMLAIQGPEVKNLLSKWLNPDDAQKLQALKPFSFIDVNGLFAARTGYTGEDGYEIIFPASEAKQRWDALLNAGIKPCGLGARDTLRLEAGLNLYGSDMDESVTPLESNLAWTVAMEPAERDFIGRQALAKQLQQGVKHKLVGLVLDGAGIIRNHQKIFTEEGSEGEVTSGGYSPTLSCSIALARVPANTGTTCLVEIRGKRIPAHVIKPPFVRQGKKMFSIEREQQ